MPEENSQNTNQNPGTNNPQTIPATPPPVTTAPTVPEQPVQPPIPNEPISPPRPAQPTTTSPDNQEKLEKVKILKKQKESKKIVMGCLGAGCGTLVLAFFGFILFVSQNSEGASPLLKMLNIEEGSLINTLIDITNLGFGFLTFIAFIVAIIGLFKIGTVKKEDTEGKKKGIILSLIGILGFLLFVFLWITAYFYLDSKKINVTPANVIITDPADVTNLTAPETVSFDASNIPLKKKKVQILTFKWEYGDGDIGNGDKVSHTYKSKGENDGRYNATLTVTYKDERSDKEMQEKYTINVIFINEKVQAQFDATPQSGEAPLTVKFDASKSIDPDGQIMNYEWDFNEDDRFDDAKGETAEYTYEKIGKFKAKLRVTDNNNDFAVAEKNIEVLEPNKPTAVINHDNNGDVFSVGKEVSFNGENSKSPDSKIVKYEWDFGDGSPKVNTKTVGHIFKKEGNYTVTLKVIDEKDQEGIITLNIKVKKTNTTPQAVITTKPNLEKDQTVLNGTPPLNVEFDASKSLDPDNNIIEYKWDFDNNGKIDSRNATAAYTYTEPGEYEAKLTVIDADDNANETTLKIKVETPEFKAVLKADKISGEVPLTVTFDASASSYPNGEIAGYEWDFGDGATIRIGDAKISHKYTAIGTFEAKVTAIASDTKKAEAKATINVRAVALTSCFKANVKEGLAPLIVTFDPRCSQGTIDKYKWDFGDGKTDTVKKPTHTFENAGIYEVTLEVSDKQNVVDKYSEQIVVKGEIKE